MLLSSWAAGGGRSSEAQDDQWAYPADAWDSEMDSGTDTDTSSDSGNEDMDDGSFQHMSQSEVAEHVYMQYRRAKRRWRRFTNKPARRFRRVIKHFKRGKGRKGSGKGKNRGFF